MESDSQLHPIVTPRSDTLILDALTRFMAQSGAQTGSRLHLSASLLKS